MLIVEYWGNREECEEQKENNTYTVTMQVNLCCTSRYLCSMFIECPVGWVQGYIVNET